MSLEDDVRDLAERVSRIEQTLGIRAAGSDAQPSSELSPAATLLQLPRLPSLLGRALLGLAGAYLLRALTESGTLPHTAGVAAGLAYAVLWVIWAARTPASEHLEIALHTLTALLVLCPLLWEATVRFRTVSTWFTAVALLLFTVFSLAVSWRKSILTLATIATLGALGTSAGLLITTHDILPFTVVFLGIAAAVEGSACLGHSPGERWLAAAVADLAVLLATWLVTNPRGLPPAYAPVPHAWLLAVLVLLLAVYLASTIVRNLVRGFTFTFFEITQCGIALAITLNGSLRLSEMDPRIAPAIGFLALSGAFACYLISVLRPEHGRNFYTYSTFGFLLVLAGSRTLLPTGSAAVLWLLLAVISGWAGGFFDRFTLQAHAGIYLLLALASLTALQQSLSALLGNSGIHWPVYAGAGASAGCYLVNRHGLLRLGLAAALALQLAAIAASALTHGYHAAFGADATHAYCATLRTTVLTGGSLLLAWIGARSRRAELQRLIYPTMLLAAYRLVADDMHQDPKAAAVLSLVLYGAVLMTLPKVGRTRAIGRQPGSSAGIG